jgi:hypothetical protein
MVLTSDVTNNPWEVLDNINSEAKSFHAEGNTNFLLAGIVNPNRRKFSSVDYTTCSCCTAFAMANYSTADPSSYFVPGYGISRAVIQSEIRYFCGPDAIVRPYTHHVCDSEKLTVRKLN